MLKLEPRKKHSGLREGGGRGKSLVEKEKECKSPKERKRGHSFGTNGCSKRFGLGGARRKVQLDA